MQASKSNFFAKSERQGRNRDYDYGFNDGNGGNFTKGKKFREKDDVNKVSRRKANRSQPAY